MWLVVMMFAAVVVTAVWYASDKARKQYNIGLLGLLLWGTSIMVLVDHLMGYHSEGGPFIESSPEAILLSIILLMTALIVWEAVLLLKDPKGVVHAAVSGRRP